MRRRRRYLLERAEQAGGGGGCGASGEQSRCRDWLYESYYCMSQQHPLLVFLLLIVMGACLALLAVFFATGLVRGALPARRPGTERDGTGRDGGSGAGGTAAELPGEAAAAGPPHGQTLPPAAAGGSREGAGGRSEFNSLNSLALLPPGGRAGWPP